ncbi:hypothetical protein RUM43_010738 [Polyplax serrata]|uniref:Chitin-binding type-2 domain-containing protein n=1 Tax=Polyplax serrata TaxID=468196 RepID=A0AAN8P7P1_POLSC
MEINSSDYYLELLNVSDPDFENIKTHIRCMFDFEIGGASKEKSKELLSLEELIQKSDSDSLELVNLKLKPRRKVKQIRPHWISKPEGGSFRATTFSDDGSYSGRNQYTPQSYAGYGGSPPWNYGNQQQPDKDNSLKERPGYYPQSGQQGNYPGAQYPGAGQPSYPPQLGYPQAPKPGYPQAPQPGYPQAPQTGYPQAPQPGYPQAPGYPQGPQAGYPGFGQRPGGSQTIQGPSAPGVQPTLPQRPPDNQIYPGSPFYPQIQPGLPGPPEIPPSELLKYCKAPRGQFGLESSCQKYVDCWDDVAVEQTCSGNLLFNEDKKYCDFPENVDCGGRPINEQPSTSSNEGNCSAPFSTYRSSTNCGEFFMCSHSIPYKFLCPGGLAYNNDLGVCDYEYRVECNGVPVLPVEETTTDPNYTENYGNPTNDYNLGSNQNYYGSSGSSGPPRYPYGRSKLTDEEHSKSGLELIEKKSSTK